MANSSAEEPSLLQLVASGDPMAVSRVLDRYGALVWSIARRQIDPATAEDLVQEIFIDVWKSADRFDPQRGSEAAFITTIARRRLVDHRRRVSRRIQTDELQPDETSVEQEEVDMVELADEARVAASAIAQLKPEQSQVLEMSLVQGLSHSQISQATQLPLGTVKSHARRGLERVRAMIERPAETPAEGTN